MPNAHNLLAPAVVWGGAIGLLAQAPAFDAGIIQIIGNGVTVAVLAWYVVYDLRVRTPQMLAAFSAEQSATRKTFADELAAARQTFITEQNASRQSFAVEQAAARQTFVIEQAAARTHHEQDVGKLHSMLFDNMTAMRRAVHDVKDTAHTLMLKKQVSEAEQAQ